MFETVTKNGRVLALIPADRTIPDGDAALELAVSARYETDSARLVIPKILQKWTNYGFRAAIFGDFSAYTEVSKSLRDFIYECNRGTAVFFVPTRQEAEERLSQV